MEIKYEQPPIYKMAKEVADKAMDEFEIDGKTLRQWIKEVEKYYLKKEQGKIIELPCKPGDTVYYIYMDCPEDYKKEYCTDHKGSCEKCPHRVPTIMSKKYTMNDIGTPVYLTEHEAKEALEGMKND